MHAHAVTYACGAQRNLLSPSTMQIQGMKPGRLAAGAFTLAELSRQPRFPLSFGPAFTNKYTYTYVLLVYLGLGLFLAPTSHRQLPKVPPLDSWRQRVQ